MQLYFGELVHKGRFKYYCAAASIVMPALRSLQPRQASPRSAALTALSPNLTMMLLSLSLAKYTVLHSPTGFPSIIIR